MQDIKDIANFRELVTNMSLEQLEEQKQSLQDQISKMILDSDLILKVAIVENLIKEKKGE